MRSAHNDGFGHVQARLEDLLSDAVTAYFSIDPPPADCAQFVGEALMEASIQGEAGTGSTRLAERLKVLVQARSEGAAWTNARREQQEEIRAAAAQLRKDHASRPPRWLVDAAQTELAERAMELQAMAGSSQADVARALADEETRAGRPLAPPERVTLTLSGRARMPQQARVLGTYTALPHAVHGRRAFSKEDNTRVLLSWDPEATQTAGGGDNNASDLRSGQGSWVVWLHPEPCEKGMGEEGLGKQQGEQEGEQQNGQEGKQQNEHEGEKRDTEPREPRERLLFVHGEADDPSRATGVWCMPGQRGYYKRPGIRCYRAETREAERSLRETLKAELLQLGQWQLLASAELVRRDAEAAATARVPSLRALGGRLQAIREAVVQPPLATAPPSEQRGAAVASLRQSLRAAQALVGEAQAAIDGVAIALPATSRAGYLRSLRQLLGMPPASGTWEDDWTALRADKLNVSVSSIRAKDGGLEASKAANAADIEQLVSSGWPRDDATATICLLETFPNELAKALRKRNPTYARSTFALHDAICRAALRQHTSDASPTPPTLYMNLRSQLGTSLVSGDPGWADLLVADRTGFRGLSSSVAIAEAHCDPRCFNEAGYCKRLTGEEGVSFMPVGGDVVAFESRPKDELGLHAAVMLTETRGTFPPNTLFRLKEVVAPGEWVAPGGVRPAQRLLVVTATYQRPHDATNDGGDGGKLCGASSTLSYGAKDQYIRGLDDILAKPILSMEQEFDRELSWRDWKGATHSLREAWAYVTGPARRTEGCTPGVRDASHDGKTPAEFLAAANSHIADRRAAGHGTSLAACDALLTLDEVLAVRLYSGPAYDPINGFLRQVAGLSGRYREAIARHAEVTFTATIGHLCRAVRKLAAVATHEEAAQPLWRGVRGELPRSFWAADETGVIAAVDMAFMSTSRHERTPIEYMGGGANVLWELRPQTESDSAYHRGADISMLSQFEGEREVLFPPCTMLEVKRAPGSAAEAPRTETAAAHGDARTLQVYEEAVGEKAFMRIVVLPHFL